MGDISYSARAGGSPQPSGSGRAEPLREEPSAEEIRRIGARVQLAVERMTHEIEARTRPPQEVARERWAEVPRRPESEMRELLETELSRYATLPDDWDGYSSKPPSPGTLRDVRAFLSKRPADVPLPYPALGIEGEMELCWDSADLSVAVMFEGDRKFHFVVFRYSRGKETGWSGTEDCPVGSEWPEALAGPLREL